MKKIIFTTTNEAKVFTLQKIVGDDLVTIEGFFIDIPEIRSMDTEEIARQKVLYAFKQLGQPVIAQDGGFFIDALNGFPATYVHLIYNTIGIEGILTLMEGKEDRRCEFCDSLAYMDGDLSEPIVFTARTVGSIADHMSGELQAHDFGQLRKIFIPKGSDKVATALDFDSYEALKETHQEDKPTFLQFAEWLKKSF